MAHILPNETFETCDGLFYCMAKWVYDVTDGLAFTLFLTVFCGIIFASTSRFGRARSLGFASVTCMLGAIMLSILNLMPWWVGTIYILSGAGGFVYMIMNEK